MRGLPQHAPCITSYNRWKKVLIKLNVLWWKITDCIVHVANEDVFLHQNIVLPICISVVKIIVQIESHLLSLPIATYESNLLHAFFRQLYGPHVDHIRKAPIYKDFYPQSRLVQIALTRWISRHFQETVACEPFSISAGRYSPSLHSCKHLVNVIQILAFVGNFFHCLVKSLIPLRALYGALLGSIRSSMVFAFPSGWSLFSFVAV